MFEQERVLVRLQQLVLREAEIVVCLLAGSYGRGTQDAYSDLDVILVFEDEARRDAAFDGRTEFVRAVMPYLPAKSCDLGGDQHFQHVAIYSNGAKVDLRYVTKESLLASAWSGEFRILKDPDGWGARFQAGVDVRSQGPSPAVTAQALADLDNTFWVTFMEVYRLLLRGDHDGPFVTYLQLLNETIPPLLSLLPPEDPAYEGLIRASYSHDVQATRHHLCQLMKAYSEARSAVIRRHDLLYTPERSFEEALRRMIERSAL